MAHTEERLINGIMTPVTVFDHSAQEIDDAVTIEDVGSPGCFYRVVDGEKEWVNPPMVLGNEYRTTSKFKGRPVYTALVWLGSVSNEKKVLFGNDIDTVLLCNAFTPSSTFPVIYYSQSDRPYNTCFVATTISQDGGATKSCEITCLSGEKAGWSNVTCIIKYTKLSR